MPKMHLSVPQRMIRLREKPFGTGETLTIAVAACDHVEYPTHMTTDESFVTCKRCRGYLHRLKAPTQHPYTVILQLLDGEPLEACAPPTYLEWVETATVIEAIAAAKAQCCHSMDYADGDKGYAEFHADLYPLLVLAGHHQRLHLGE